MALRYYCLNVSVPIYGAFADVEVKYINNGVMSAGRRAVIPVVCPPAKNLASFIFILQSLTVCDCLNCVQHGSAHFVSIAMKYDVTEKERVSIRPIHHGRTVSPFLNMWLLNIHILYFEHAKKTSNILNSNRGIVYSSLCCI